MGHQRKALPVLAAALAVGLGACGGGGGADAPSATSAVEGSAASVNAAALLKALAEFQSTLPAVEVIDPTTLQRALPPINDTAEPTPVT